MKVKNRENLSIDEQIKRLERHIKFHYIFAPIWCVIIVVVSIILIICTPEWGLGVGFLVTLPFSIWLSWLQNVKDSKDEIKKLQKENTNDLLQMDENETKITK